jgi:hypothetical protein
MDAAMRSHFHPPLSARRLPRSVGQARTDVSAAEACLGARDPLVGVLRRSDTVRMQLVSVTAVQAACVFLSGDLKFGLSLALAALVVQVGLGCRLAALRAHRRDLCLELIVAGRQALPLACVDRQRRRLLDPRTRERLARSIDEIANSASRPLPVHPAVRPIFYVLVIRRVAPELCQVALLLRGDAPCVRGVAAVEWLLTSPASPLYGVDVEPLREELGRVRYLLSLTP